MHLSHLSLKEAITSIEKCEISPIELTQSLLTRIELLNPRLNCYLRVYSEFALEQAHDKTKLIGKLDSLPTLFGIPIGLKDLIALCNFPLIAGSRVWENHIASEDAYVVNKLRRAGAIFIGHQNMHEIALGVTNVNPHFGACRNPWKLDRISGGSSGGSAVAVASGLCLGALGTDTGGSIRIPASLCGVVGFKPTFGRISLRGVLPLSWNLDHVGTLTKSVEDAAILYHVIAGYDNQDPYSVPKPLSKSFHPEKSTLQGIMVAYAMDNYFTQANAEIIQAVHQAAKVFDDLGATVEEVKFPNAELAAQANSEIVISEAAAVYEKQLNETPDLFGEDVLQRLHAGAKVPSTQYIQDRHFQSSIKRQFHDFFHKYDILLIPTTPITAPLIQGDNAIEEVKVLTRFTAPFNLSGLPAITLTCGFDQQELPIGLQLVTKAWNEELLLQIAHIYEQAAGWQKFKPSLY